MQIKLLRVRLEIIHQENSPAISKTANGIANSETTNVQKNEKDNRATVDISIATRLARLKTAEEVDNVCS
jgi:hypothetical protein